MNPVTVKLKTALAKWPDATGYDDHGRDGPTGDGKKGGAAAASSAPSYKAGKSMAEQIASATGPIDEKAAMNFFGRQTPETALQDKFNATQKAAGLPEMTSAEFMAMRYYLDSGYSRFNTVLRDDGFRQHEPGTGKIASIKPFKEGTKTTDNFFNAARLVTSAMDKLGTVKDTVYRALNFNDQQHLASFLASAKEGMTITDRGFASASKSLADLADLKGLFVGTPNVRLDISSKTGVDASRTFLQAHEEGEVLFRPNTSFKVESVGQERQKGAMVHVIKLSEV